MSAPATRSRSEALLPADPTDAAAAVPEVAEEVSLDLQSPCARRVGAAPADSAPARPGEALAEALQPSSATEDSKLQRAIDNAIPPSG